MSRRCTAALLAAAFVLTVAPSARADWFASEAVDGPADIVKVGGVDLGRDGHGAVVYLRRDAGVAHVFVSRIYDGAFHAPEQVDVGIPEEATDAAVAAADDHRLVVVWISGNRVYGSFTPGGAVGTMSPPQLLADPGGQPHDVDVDMGINGTAYATFTVPGAGGSDVAAVRLQGSTWEAVPQPLDIDPSRAAGAGTGRARVAVSAEGNAVATWGEAGAIFARRITGLNVSVAPQLVSLGRRRRRLAGHRHRGRRLVRLGRLPPGPRRRVPGGRAPAGGLAVRGPGVHRRPGRDSPEHRDGRARLWPGGLRRGRRLDP